MKKKINKRLMGTATLAIFSTLLLTVAVCYNLYKTQVLADLRIYAGTVESLLWGMQEEEAEAPDKDGAAPVLETGELSKEITGKLAGIKKGMERDFIRMTIVAEDGEVLYDSVAQVNRMENHRERPEIKAALQNGEGSAVRESYTLAQSTYYYALKTENGMVLRVSRDADSIFNIVEYAVPYILAVIAVLLLVCAIISHYLAEGIIRPIKLIAKEPENLEEIEAYEEMKPYIDAIKTHHEDVIANARIRQEFTANVSHELKTPLTAISGYSELIENGMVAEETEIRRFAGEIHKSANRLLTLINDVIRLSELDNSEAEEVFEKVNLYECAENCVEMLRINAEKHQVTLSFDGEESMIMANKQMVEEVLYNLCDNAIRYNREGGSVSVLVENRLDKAVLTVKDTGIGIPKEHQERVFERFYRVDKSRSKSTGGTGLGLAIVKHILIKLGAEMKLHSEYGKGTEITVTFPVAEKIEKEA